MKVLICFLENRFGGPLRRAGSIAEKLITHDIETLFLLNEKLKRHIPIDGMKCFLVRHSQCLRRKSPVINLLAFCLFFPWNLFRICRIIRSEAIDIVHVNGITNILPVLAANATGTRVLWHLNDTYAPWVTKKLGLMLLRSRPHKILVTSNKVSEYYFGKKAKLYAGSKVLGIPIDMEEFSPDEIDDSTVSTMRVSWGIPQDCTVIGSVGNISGIKGYEYFIEAAYLIKKRVSNVKFLIVGAEFRSQQKFLRKLRSLISARNLDGDIIFTGFQKNVPAFLSLMDVFVLSSVSESGPLVLLEAQAMKIPVVATDVGLVSEQIVDGKTGIIVQPGDPEAIAEGVVTLLEMTQETRQQMVEEARERVRKCYSLDTIALRQKTMYEEIMEQCIPQAD